MAMSYNNGNSILVDAAMNRIEDVFGAVLFGIEKVLSPQEVRTNDCSEYFVTCSRVECKSLIPKFE